MPPARVLIALPDSEASDLGQALEAAGEVVTCRPDELEGRLDQGPWTVILADPDLGGRRALERARALSERPAVVLLAGFGSVVDAVEAMRSGAFDYLSRPASGEQVTLAVQRALEQRVLESENERLRRTLEERRSLGGILTRDPALTRVLDTALIVAPSRANVLITGESGTGKTRLARAIHAASDRARGPFVEVNCGALPATLLESELFGHRKGAFTGATEDRAGKIECAHGGTLFLDEIATASSDLQVKLLRVLQERVLERVGETRSRQVDVRVISATNVDLTAEVEAGRFRQDLYWRIHVVALELPPLRARPRDVTLLAKTFLERFAREYERPVPELSPEALAALSAHSWPGNVRELENVLERALLLARGPLLGPADLGPSFERAASEAEPSAGGAFPWKSLKEALEGPEKRIIQRALEYNGGRRGETAAMLGVNRTTLFNKMRKYGLLGTPKRGAPS